MIKNKFSTFLLIVYYSTLSNFAFARVITVDRCTIPFDFTIEFNQLKNEILRTYQVRIPNAYRL